MLQSPSIPGRASRYEDTSLRRLRSLHAIGADMDTASDTSPSERLRLLLVEKDEAMRTMLLKTLGAHYQVEATTDGLTACQAARLHPPALVLIDLYTPGTDNLTLIRAMRAEACTEMIPIIMLTASTHKELLLRCLTAGASNFLLKPFTTTELLMCARVELQLRGAHAASAQ